MTVPDWLCGASDGVPTVYIETPRDVRLGPDPDPGTLDRANRAIYTALMQVCRGMVSGQALIKVHVGEPKCSTRMRPEYVAGAARFLRERGAGGVAAGDTTVAYTGGRGHRENPVSDARAYLALAEAHGWSEDGPAGAPFVVLDRPSTAAPGQFEFSGQARRVEVAGMEHFHDVFVSEGFLAADFVVNYAHLTLHGLAGVAGCVKSIAMGCAGLEGKLRMHQSLLPHFDEDRCAACGMCVDNCPENALTLNEEASCPVVDPDLCIGCGECEAVCAPGHAAVALAGEAISDWERGQDTLPVRMADYTLGMMQGKWDRTLHVLHLYAITPRCDCLDTRQRPMLHHDLGFLVGRDPFAVDMWGARLLAGALEKQGVKADRRLLGTAERTAMYVHDRYGIRLEETLEKLTL